MTKSTNTTISHIKKDSTDATTSDVEDQNLFTVAMKGEWQKVLNMCKKDVVAALKLKLTRSGATVLHVAVTESQADTVQELVEHICSLPDIQQRNALLRVRNDGGYTALHLAASMGNFFMCRCIAGVDPSLVGVPNNNGETPLFLAALHGKSRVFLYLHSLCGTELGYSYARRKDGDTFLHCAIAGEYMGLAYKIIEKYEKLVDSVNEKGYTPLHVLASKPLAFRSGGNDFGLFSRFVYERCFHLEKLNIPDDEEQVDTPVRKDGTTRSDSKPRHDVENPGTPEPPHVVDVSRSQKPRRSGTIRCKIRDLIGLAFRSMYRKGVMITKKLSFTKKIREVKTKHTWSIEIMKELIARASIYEWADPAGPNRDQEEPSDDAENPIEVIKKAVEEDKKKNGREEITSNETVAIGGKTAILVAASNGTVLEMVDKILGKKKNGREGITSRETVAIGSETAILVAAKNGITEIVDAILAKFPVAINDKDASKRNIVLLAAENRHVGLFKVFEKHNVLRESIIHKTDNDGNSALHAAAVYAKDKPWPIAGPAAQMQREIQWFEFVKESLPDIYLRRNNKEKTPEEIFTETHEKPVREGAKWLVKTSESCSVVAALIVAVAFATSSTLPGGTDDKTGKPKLEGEKAFDVFAISSLVALFFSVTSLTMFLAILTSRFQQRDFARDLPGKLLVGLTSLFVSIASMLVSFSAAHSLVTEDKLKYAVFPVYAVACLPVSIFAVAQCPLYFDLIRANLRLSAPLGVQLFTRDEIEGD